MIYNVSITKKGQMTLPKQIRNELGLTAPGRVTIKVSPKGSLALSKPVPLEDIHKILGQPDGREFLTEREKIIIPQVMKKYPQYAKKSS